MKSELEAQKIWVIWYWRTPYHYEAGRQLERHICFTEAEFKKQLEAVNYLYQNATVKEYKLTDK